MLLLDAQVLFFRHHGPKRLALSSYEEMISDLSMALRIFERSRKPEKIRKANRKHIEATLQISNMKRASRFDHLVFARSIVKPNPVPIDES